MIVNDIILSIRAKIGDDGIKKRWSDEELMDSINSALTTITEEANPWDDGEWIINLIAGKSRYELPPYFYRLSLVKINGQKLPKEHILGYELFKETDNNRLVVSTSINNLHIKPAKFAKEILDEKGQVISPFVPDKLTVYYDREEQIAYLKDEINLPDRFKDVIVFYAMHLVHQNPIRKDGDQKSLFYLNLFNEKIKKLKSSTYRNKHSKRMRSPHVRF